MIVYRQRHNLKSILVHRFLPEIINDTQHPVRCNKPSGRPRCQTCTLLNRDNRITRENVTFNISGYYNLHLLMLSIWYVVRFVLNSGISVKLDSFYKCARMVIGLPYTRLIRIFKWVNISPVLIIVSMIWWWMSLSEIFPILITVVYRNYDSSKDSIRNNVVWIEM